MKNADDKTETIAIIDTETNFDDIVMSIGVVFADSIAYKPIKSMYYIFDKQAKVGGLYYDSLYLNDINNTKRTSRSLAIQEILAELRSESVNKLFAYNASFDKSHLPELKEFGWYDIMQIAIYRQYNSKIPADAECYGTGRLKRNYGVESILRMMTGNLKYFETHNACRDALDELKIMELLNLSIDVYDKACIKRAQSSLKYQSQEHIFDKNFKSQN